MATRDMLLVALFTALLTVGSQFVIPLGPVPMTMQVLLLMLAGMVLGSRRGLMSVGLWMMMGVLGLPVFAQGKAGILTLVGPTGGFIFGYVFCVYLVGYVTERKEMGFGPLLTVLLAGLVVLYGFGLAGFMLSFHYFLHKPMLLEQAMLLAVWPFLPFDVIKTVVAAWIGLKIKRSLSKAGFQLTI